jgi:WD40 repeat protein
LKDKIQDRELLDEISILRNDFCALVFLHKSKFATSHQDSKIRIWSLEIKLSTQSLREHSESVWGLILTKDGYLVSGSCDNTIKIWNYTTSRCVKNLTGHRACVTDLVSFNNGSLLLSGSEDKTIKVWDLKNLIAIKTLTGHLEVISSLLMLNNVTLASGYFDGQIII